MPPLLLSLIFLRLPKAQMPFFLKPIVRGIADKVRSGYVAPQIALHLDYMESELGKSEWFAGAAFSAADVQMSFPIEAAAMRGGLGEERPKLADWLQRIHARPAYQRALAKGGPLQTLD